MKKGLMIILFLFCVSVVPLAAQEKVVVGGSGALTGEMAALGKAFMAKNPADSIHVLMDSMSSAGGIEGVKLGRLTVGLVTDEPQGADKEKLTYKAVGRTPTAVAVNKSLPIASLSEAQICDIFSGKIKSWKEVGAGDAKIMVLTRKKDDANTGTMREKMACFKSLQITAEAIALVRGSEVLDALDKRATTIGIVNVNMVLFEHEHVITLAIDGVTPNPETVQSGKYKYFNESGVVTLGPAKGAAKRFLEFAASAEGQKVLAKVGVVPVK